MKITDHDSRKISIFINCILLFIMFFPDAAAAQHQCGKQHDLNLFHVPILTEKLSI